jgi:acid phosphatase
MAILAVLLAVTLPLADLANAERVLGAYLFQRHGDRTPKELPPTKLTYLGYNEEYVAGTVFRDRYILPGSSNQIEGISTDLVNLAQITASAPQDTVIQLSGQAFLQGLYPAAGSSANETLRNGSTIDAPLSGYQLIPIKDVQSGAGSEDNPWLQSTSLCNNADLSSNNFYYSSLYNNLMSSTHDLYQSLEPLLSHTYTSSQMNFKNAFGIWDMLHVALIHNSTSNFPNSDLINDEIMQQLLGLANTHEFNLAYNNTDTIRAVAGMTLAGQVLTSLNQTIVSGGKSKLSIQFGSYATFLSYFGLAGLTSNDVNFTGMPDYCSSMAWELITNAPGTDMPSESDISVRFVFNNGTINNSAQLQSYPLFGQSSIELPWMQFVENTNRFALTSQQQWCQACGNSTGVCTSIAAESAGPLSSGSSSKGISPPVAGVIGAMVTLGVLGFLTALTMLVFGLRLVRMSAGAFGTRMELNSLSKTGSL